MAIKKKKVTAAPVSKEREELCWIISNVDTGELVEVLPENASADALGRALLAAPLRAGQLTLSVTRRSMRPSRGERMKAREARAQQARAR